LTENYNPIVIVPTSTRVFLSFYSLYIKLFHGTQHATVYKYQKQIFLGGSGIENKTDYYQTKETEKKWLSENRKKSIKENYSKSGEN